MKDKPVILWTCDVPGWAYHNRIMLMSKFMPQYEHRIWYFGEHKTEAERRRIVSEADIIVCQGVKSLRIIQWKNVEFVEDKSVQDMLNKRFSNIVARLDSVRIDIDGIYVDIWDKKENQ
jgi:hypothetical protein